jgi:hypothetical protein
MKIGAEKPLHLMGLGSYEFYENCWDVDEISSCFQNFSSYLYKIRHRRCTKIYCFNMNYVKVATLAAIR